MDCSWGEGNNACDGGEDYRAYQWIIKHGGLSTEDDYGPYKAAVSYFDLIDLLCFDNRGWSEQQLIKMFYSN